MVVGRRRICERWCLFFGDEVGGRVEVMGQEVKR